MKLEEIQNNLKERISMGLNYGIKAMDEMLSSSSALHSQYILLKSQYNDLNRLAMQNILPYEQIEVGLNKIRQSIINLVNEITLKDVVDSEQMPALKNNELQYRKSNFFELLKIHLNNLAQVKVTYKTTHDNHTEVEEYSGRMAFRDLYKDYFVYGFMYQNPQKKLEIQAYSHLFFSQKIIRLEVYMKTLKMIMNYILEEEMEQQFFVDILKSLLSTDELRLVFYYAISNIDPQYRETLKAIQLFDDSFRNQLIEATHFDQYYLA